MAGMMELPVDRVRRALRFVERVRETETDRTACLDTACAGLQDLFTAAVAVVGHVRSSDPATLIELVSVGWRNESARGLVMNTDPAAAASRLPRFGELSTQPAATTARRVDLLGDADWNVHPHLIMRGRPAGLDDFMVCTFALVGPAGDRGVILLYRSIGAPPFSEGDRELLHALAFECGTRFWSAVVVPSTLPVTVRSAPSARGERSVSATPSRVALLDRLTPAQRAVLPYLLEGKTEAEIGKLVFRSRYTVHDHARAIYLALGVRNRVELVLLFNRAAEAPQDALTV